MDSLVHQSKEILKHLIKITEDGISGYKTASSDSEDATLKQVFLQYSGERAFYSEELKKELEKLGDDPGNGGDLAGALHRTWIDIKSTITPGDRVMILNACITGEEFALKEYDDALSKITEKYLHKLIESQNHGIQKALDNLKILHQSSSR